MKRKTLALLSVVVIVLAIFATTAPVNVAQPSQGSNVLICQAWMPAKVYELDGAGNNIWEVSGYYRAFDAERLKNGNTLITNGLNGNQVLEVDPAGNTVWSVYARSPMDAERLDNGNTLIAERGRNRVIEVDPAGNIVWNTPGRMFPWDVERLDNGNTLVADWGYGAVREFSPSGAIVWQKTGIWMPSDAERLPNGNTLIAIGWPSAVREFDAAGNVVRTVWSGPAGMWQTAEDIEVCENGNILVVTYTDIYEIDPTGATVWHLPASGGWYSSYFDIEVIDPIKADVIVKPETLNDDSNGDFTVFIELPEEYDVKDIDPSTIVCNGAPCVRGHAADKKFVAKFDREDLTVLPIGDDVKFEVEGNLFDGSKFKGSDTIDVIDR
jgi:hypothetical protein